MTLRHRLMTMAVASTLAFSAGAMAAGSVVTEADEDRIEADYKAAKERCDDATGNAKDVCLLEAKGAQKVAKAELKVREEDSPRNRYKLSLAKAQADYDVAKEKCDELAGNTKDVCVKDAKAAFAAAKADAKAALKTSKARSEAREQVRQSREDATQTKRDANYAAAKERCDIYAGDAKDRCVAEAKARFGVN